MKNIKTIQYKHNSDKGSNLEPKTSTILGNRQEKHKNLLRGYSKTFHSERRSRVPDKVDGRCLQKLRNRGLLETEVVGVGKAKEVRGLRVTLLYDDDSERLGVIRHFTESELFGIFRRVPEIRKAANAIRETIRSWELARLSPLSMESIAGRINVTVRGWIDYYGAFFKSELKRVFRIFKIQRLHGKSRVS